MGLAHADTAPWPDIALCAVRQAQRLEHPIAQLLVQAKSDAAQEADRRQTVDLCALLTEIRVTTLAPGISISIRVPPETVTAGNCDELTRMFRNLVDNAARYAESSVVVSAVPGPGSIAVEITDDGPGIPASQRQRVFDRFVRLDPSREHASGSAGLGLAIAREIATAHQASIELTEAGSGGVRAVVTLPAAHVSPARAEDGPMPVVSWARSQCRTRRSASSPGTLNSADLDQPTTRSSSWRISSACAVMRGSAAGGMLSTPCSSPCRMSPGSTRSPPTVTGPPMPVSRMYERATHRPAA